MRMCAPVCVPRHRAGGVRRAPPSVSGPTRRRLQPREAHRWLRGPDARGAPLFRSARPSPAKRGRSPRRRSPRSGGGNRAGAPCRGPRAPSRAMVLNGQLRALQPGAQPPPQTPKMSFCSPGAPKLCTEPTPFPPPSASSGDSCYCQHPQGSDRRLPTVTFSLAGSVETG